MPRLFAAADPAGKSGYRSGWEKRAPLKTPRQKKTGASLTRRRIRASGKKRR
jgi:hypothetical protein